MLPPSPQLPTAVTDLAVFERGDQLLITFSTPPRTTDNLPIKEFGQIDLRVGPAITPFDLARWAANAKRYDVVFPPPNDPDNPLPQPMSQTVAIADWVGHRVAVAVRTSVKEKDHFSQWSNVARIEVIPVLNPPSIKLTPTAQGIRVSWTQAEPGITYEVFRQGPNDKEATSVGTTDKAEFIDTTSLYDTPYQYQAIARKGGAESLPSSTETITAVDVFPPSIPTGVTALATPGTIELSWQRSPESDTKGYYVYRSVNGGKFERVGDLVNVPTFSDHQVQHGNTYQYAISAVDQKNNESERSHPEDVHF